MTMNKDIALVLRIKPNEKGEIEVEKLSKNKKIALENVRNAGFEIKDTQDSIQGYLAVYNPKTKKHLVISKDYEGKTRLYNRGVWVISEKKTIAKVLEKMDFVGYLNKPIKEQYSEKPLSKVSDFKYNKMQIATSINIAKDYKEKMESAQKAYEEWSNRTEKLKELSKKMLERK